MLISILSLFPGVVEPFLNHSIIKRAREKRKVQFNLINWRDFTSDKHHTVDEHPYGGGAGMLLMIEPIVKALEQIENQFGKAHKVLLSPQGTIWQQQTAKSYIRKDISHLVLICGHYEGFDERLLEFVNEQVSIGQYVLSGGESAAIVIIDSLVRLLPGVLKKTEATLNESFMKITPQKLYEVTKDKKVLQHKSKSISLLEYPQYTKPENYRGFKVPKVLLSGNHREIESWRLRQAWDKTQANKHR